MNNFLETIKDKQPFFKVAFLVYLYRGLLDMVYVKGIYPYYAYLYNFKYSYSVERIFYSYLLTFLFAVIIYKYVSKTNLSSLFIFTISLVYFIPNLSVYCWDGLSQGYFIYYLTCFIFLVLSDRLVPPINFVRNKYYSQNFPNYIAIFVAVVNALIVVFFIGFTIKIDLTDVYNMREEWASQNLPSVVSYFQPFAARLIPVLIVYYICRKKYLMVIILIVSQLLSFSFSGLKYIFFALIIGVLIGFFYNNLNRISVIYGLIIANIFSVFELFILKRESLFVTFFTRRISFIPNKISYFYYEFFEKNELLYLRESFMRWFGLSNPYKERIPAVIGNYAFGVKMGANTGLFGEAFSQFGFFSALIYPFLYIFAFRLLEACVKVQNVFDYKVAFTAVILYTISFIDGAYFSILLTQGFLLFCLSMYLISKVKNEGITYNK